MAIYIPDKRMRGRPVSDPGSPNHGKILLKYPSGIIAPPTLGRPSWISTPYSGSSILDPAPTGFTNVPTSGDSRLIYVDPEGSDSADGSSPGNAVKTLNRARNLQRSGYPDRVLFKRGGVWREPFQTSSSNWKSGNPDMPAVLGWYGDPTLPRPRFELSSDMYLSRDPISHMQLHGLGFYGYKADPSHPEFAGSGGKFNLHGEYDNILFEDIAFWFTELVIQTHHSRGDVPKDIYLNWCLHNGKYVTTSSTSTSSRPSNLYISGWRKLRITNCVSDHGGWHDTVEGAGANTRNHNYYLNYVDSSNDLIFENNISTRASSHGAQIRAGGIAKDNFFGRNALGLLIGYGQERFEFGEIGQAFDNVVSEGINMYKGANACQNGVCSRAVYGIDFDLNGDITPGNFQCKRNIVSTVDPAANASGLAFFGSLMRRSIWYHNQAEQTITDVVDEDNIAWKWASETEGTGVNYRDPGRTLSDYYKYLNGIPEGPTDRFDDFMQEVLNRPPRSRDENYESRQINAFIRQGFEVL